MFPDFCDVECVEDEDVVLEDEVLDLDGDSVEGLEVGGEEATELKVMEITDVMDEVESTDVSVRRLPVVAAAEESFIVLWPMDSLEGPPVVVVTTPTPHSACMPRPAWKRAITVFSGMSSFWQLAWTAVVICTSPWRQLLEHCEPLMKSLTVQPGIASL